MDAEVLFQVVFVLKGFSTFAAFKLSVLCVAIIANRRWRQLKTERQKKREQEREGDSERTSDGVSLPCCLADHQLSPGRTPGPDSKRRGWWNSPAAAPAVGRAGGPRCAPPAGAGT